MSDKEKVGMTRAERIFVRISIVQTILAVTGFLVGVIALFAALNEADAVRKQQMASVWPHITVRDINYGEIEGERFEVVVGNRGIGPARVVSAEVLLDGASVESWIKFVEPLSDGQQFSISNFRVSGSVLAPKEDVIAFAINEEYAPKAMIEAVREVVWSRRVNILICYCSVFDDCWRLNAMAEETTAVDKCPAPDAANRI
jgi:hypothetical protein